MPIPPAADRPPPPSLVELEAAAARLWPAAERQPLHGWTLRAGGARSRRLNAVQTLAFDAGIELDTAIDAVEAWYRARDRPPCFQLTDAARPANLDAALAARGYAIATPTSVLLADVDAIPPTPAAAAALSHTATPEVREALTDPSWGDAVRRQRAALFDRLPANRRFVLIRVGGEPAGGGLCVVEGALGAIFSMRTQPRFRRRGIARSALLALAAWAREAGAAWLFLQVEDDNPILPFYRQVGFRRRHGYHYRELGSLPDRAAAPSGGGISRRGARTAAGP